MLHGRPPARDLAALVDHMFDAVLSPEEREGLLVRIRDWEERNPGLSSAERVTGWIDVAYAFQAERAPFVTHLTPVFGGGGTFVTA